MYKAKRFLALIVVAVLAISIVLSGCGKTQESSGEATVKEQAASEAVSTESQKEELAPVELVYYTPWNGPMVAEDIKLVNDEMNRILKEKINATIKINAIDFGNYAQKMNVVEASGDPFDLCFTSYWLNDYYKLVANDYLLKVDDLLPKYAPDLWKLVPQKFWDATRVKGGIYGIINYQISVDDAGIGFNTVFYDKIKEKTGFDIGDLNSYNTFESFEPVYEAIKKANLPRTVACRAFPFAWANIPTWWGYDTIGDNKSVGWVKLDDSTMTVINQYEAPFYKNYIKLMRKWMQAGYIRKDAAVAEANDKRYDNYGPWPAFYKPGQNEQAEIDAGGKAKIVQGYTGKYVVTTNRAIATMMGIPKASKNPERALMYLNLMATDEKLYNTLAVGIEDKHYEKVSDKVVDFPKGVTAATTTYYPNMGWALGNQFLEYLRPGYPQNLWADTIKINESAIASPLLGFSYNQEPIKTEIAACQTVLDEFCPGLDTGTVDPDEYYPKFIEKLKAAGVDKIIAEKQKQINAWKATLNK